MKMKVKSNIKTIILGFVVFCIFVAWPIFIQQEKASTMSTHKFSNSIEESKQYGVFVGKVKPLPNEVCIEGNRIKFTECWVEKRTKVKFFLFIKNKIILNDYFLCYKAQIHKPKDFGLNFYLNNEENREQTDITYYDYYSYRVFKVGSVINRLPSGAFDLYIELFGKRKMKTNIKMVIEK